jgi:hypothetical protein
LPAEKVEKTAAVGLSVVVYNAVSRKSPFPYGDLDGRRWTLLLLHI